MDLRVSVAILATTAAVSSSWAATVTVMVVYDSAALQAIPQPVGYAQNQIDMANGVLAASNLSDRFALTYAHASPVNPGSSELGSVLARLEIDPDIAALRTQYAADVVVEIAGALDGGCGRAHLGDPPKWPQKANTKFAAVIKRSCSQSPVSVFAHEVGHVLGAEHELGSFPAPSGYIAYNHAWIDPLLPKQTIMASSDVACGAVSCETVPQYSSPTLTFPGTTAVAGNAGSADNRRVVDEGMDIVQYYRSPAPPPPPPRPICFVEFTHCSAGRKEWIVSWEHGGEVQPYSVFDVDYTYNPSGSWGNFFDGDAICAPTTPSVNSTIYFRARVITSFGDSSYCLVSIRGATCDSETGD